MNIVFDEETLTGYADTVNTDIKYTYKDGKLTLVSGCPGTCEYGIEYDWDGNPVSDQEKWIWFGDIDFVNEMYPSLYQEVAPGPDVEMKPYYIYSTEVGSRTGMPVRVGFDEKNLWISGLEVNCPEAYVKGEIDGDNVTFTQQFICIDRKAGLFQFLMPACASFTEGSIEASSYEIADKVTMKLDRSNMTLTSAPDQVLFVNGGIAEIYALSKFEDPTLKPESNEPAARPADPVIVSFANPGSDGLPGSFVFSLPQVDINGNFLSPENLFYNLYADGELLEFLAQDYPWSLDVDVTDIPYTLYLDDIFAQNAMHGYYFYDEVEKLGVQLCYVTPEGHVLESNLVSTDDTAVDRVEASETVSVEYFDLSGMRVAHPAPGLYIKRTLTAEGQVRTEKLHLR